MHVLIIEPDPIFRAGLRTILLSHISISKTSEIAVYSKKTQLLDYDHCDIFIINQATVHDVDELPKSRFIILAKDFNKHVLLASYASGGQGYLYEKPSLDLLFHALNLNQNEFLLDPIFTPWLLKGISKDSIPSASYDTLTAREQEIFELHRSGFSYRSIAGQLGISVSTVKTHLTHIFRKLDIKRRPDKRVLQNPQSE